jgi:plastocyanin domain-containing protein
MRNDYSTRKTLGRASVFALVMLAFVPALAQEPVKPDADGVQRIRMVGGSYFFKPGHIVVKANVPVELLASRESGITPHNLVIRAPEAGISVEEDLGTDPKKILFTATKPGKYAIYCSKKLPFVAGHRDKGMEGLLEVVP